MGAPVIFIFEDVQVVVVVLTNPGKVFFTEFISSQFGLYEKCVPVGMSCGGLIASKFAARHPQYVSALYLENKPYKLRRKMLAVGNNFNIHIITLKHAY